MVERGGEPELQEEAIIERVLAGKVDDFRSLVQAHQAKIFSMIMRQVRNDSTAEDLTQECFIRAYKNLSKFRGESKFYTWLTRIALNVTNNYFASLEYRQLNLSKELKGVSPVQDNLLNEKHEQERKFRKLQDIVMQIPQRYREVVVLCSYENKSYQETAEILGIPSGTVASRMNKAFGLIKDKFKQLGELE